MTHSGRWRRRAALLLCTLGVGVACAREAATPDAAVMQFYTVLDALGIRRVPDATQWQSLDPFVADSLHGLLARARAERDSAAAAMPDEKPPFADGDLFSSLFEGRTSFATVSTIMRGDTALVITRFTNDQQKPPVDWQDTVVVVREQGRLVVADIRYGTTWEFGFRGRLLDQLTAR